MKKFIERSYSNKGYRITLHLVFWALMFASYYYFNTISFNPIRQTPATYLLALKMVIEFSFAFYSLMYFIWPRYIARKKWGKALFFFLLWVVVVAALDSWGDLLIFKGCDSCMKGLSAFSPDYYHFLQRNYPNIVFVRVVTGGFLYHLIIQLSLPVAIKIGRSYFRQTVQGMQLAKDNLQLEFNFLKSQVNPHFLFNTLNNIYSLVVNDHKEKAAATLARLSGFMRYTLYETGGEKISLDKEVQLLRDYTELEKLRLNETEVVFHYESDNDEYTIPPLLFMPALENAFKYSVDKEGGRITIHIKAQKNLLQVEIQNHFSPGKEKAPGGIGLQNLQKRVAHYFGTAATYAASAANDVYLFRLSCTLP